MGESQPIKSLKIIGIINLFMFVIIATIEFIAIFIDIPIFFVSEGDAVGFADFSGNWLDHFFKVLIDLVLAMIFIYVTKNISKDDIAKENSDSQKNALSFAIGGGFIIFGIGLLYILIWLSGFLNNAILGSLNEWSWFAGIRLESAVALINLPILKTWKNRNEIFT